MIDLVAEHTKVADAAGLLDGNTLCDLAARHGTATDGSPGELLVRLFEHLVEPALVQPTFVCQFPVEVSPLARRNDRAARIMPSRQIASVIGFAFTETNASINCVSASMPVVAVSCGGKS